MWTAATLLAGEIAWRLAIAFAWIAGELVHRLTSLSRISIYGLVGFALAKTGSDASYLRRQYEERGRSEGMVDATIGRFRGKL
jgi:hypothetical protein